MSPISASERYGKLMDEVCALLNDEDGRTLDEMRADDSFEDVTLTEAQWRDDGWDLRWGSSGIWLAGPEDLAVKAGDVVRLYGRGFGYETNGWMVNGVLVWWRTPWERMAKRFQWLAECDREQREKFVAQQAKMDAAFDALPPPLQARIERFRAESPEFRVQSEGYEMFCCTEAAKFASAATVAVNTGMYADEVDAFWRLPVGDGKGQREPGSVFECEPQDAKARWLLWAWALNSKALDYAYSRQKQVLGHDDGHSGNTFGGACALALALLDGRDV